VFNILDYSGAVFPVGMVEKSDTWEAQPRVNDLSPEDTLFREAYTGPEKYNRAPVNLQLVTRRFGEEKLLLMVDEVLKCLRGDMSSSTS
jgi:amidase